jgi:serine/threonine protein kinase/Tfp pilus assembly protein PilF
MNPTQCMDEDLALAYFERRLSPQIESSIEEHVDTCTDCRRLLSSVVAIYGDLGPAPSAQPSAAEPDFSQPACRDLARLSRGATVGRYIVVELSGIGGMGAVYRAYDPELDRAIALKVLRSDLTGPDAHKYAERLRREAQILARLNHPNVTAVYDVGMIGDQLFIAMQFIEGATLRGWLASQPRTWQEILGVLLAAGRGLAAAHAVGLVHRDVKPDNILVGANGGVWITDFGLARPHQSPPEPCEIDEVDNRARSACDPVVDTLSGTVLGTPAYMSPEQQLGSADPRSDQFSFCLTAHEALLGNRPTTASQTPGEPVVTAAQGAQVLAVPGTVRKLLLRGCAPDPDARFSDMHILLAALNRAVDRRRRVTWWLATAALLICLAGVGWWASIGRSSPCGDFSEKLLQTWDADRRAAVEKKFLESHQPYAADAWASVAKSLDSYTHRLTAQYRAACEATHVSKDQSAHLLDLRMICLDQRREELRSLVQVLATAGAGVIEQAGLAVHSLSPQESCSNARLLLLKVRPPDDPDLRERVLQMGRQIAAAEALRIAGKYADALVVLAEAEQDEGALAHLPSRAELLLLKGRLQVSVGKAQDAERTLRSAIWAAEAGRHDELAARAWNELTRLVGIELARFDDALLLADFAEAAIVRIGRDPILEAQRHNWLGAIRRLKGEFTLAREHLGQTLSLFDQALDQNDPRYADALLELGRVALDASDHAAALNSFRQAQQIRMAVLGESHPLTASSEKAVGSVLRKMGQFDDALETLRTALGKEKTALGENHPEVAKTLSDLGATLHDLGRDEDAKVRYLESLAILERALGKEHPEVAATLNNLGTVLATLGQYQDALDTYSRAQAIQKKVFGEGHLRVASTAMNIGGVFIRLGRLDEAEAHLRQALEIRTRVLGQDNPDVASCRHNLAAVLFKKERYPQALEMFEQSLDVTLKTLGADHPNAASNLDNIGNTLKRLKRLPEAVDAQERALDIRTRALGPEHISVGISLTNLGGTLLDLRRFRDASRHLKRALLIFHKSLAPDHPYCQAAEENLKTARKGLRERQQGPN